jgi:hypothetical protein
MRRVFTLLAVCCALFAATAAQAASLIDLQVIDRGTGRPLPVYRHQGRVYVVGTPGERYSLRLRNLTGARVLGVLSVDGVTAISGDTASPSQTGYVLDPYQAVEIAGWRKSADQIARFYFTSLPDSYAARTDRPENVGVIGVAAFREYVEPIAYAPRLNASPAELARDATAPAPVERQEAGSAGMPYSPGRAKDKLGTGHGEREYSTVSRTEFRRASAEPAEIVAVRYDSEERLASQGVLPRQGPYYGDTPQPFPGHFVPDPRS